MNLRRLKNMGHIKMWGEGTGIFQGKAHRETPEVFVKRRLAPGNMYVEWQLLKFRQPLRETVSKDYRK